MRFRPLTLETKPATFGFSRMMDNRQKSTISITGRNCRVDRPTTKVSAAAVKIELL